MRYGPRRVRSGRLAPLAVAGLSFAYLLSFPLAIGRADESHLLYGAKRVLQGDVIYRDFFEGITPLAFYLFAGLYALAGTTLLTARVGIAAVEAIGCGLLFHLVRRLASPAEAALAVLAFIALCVPVWPYASAHWISTTLGLAVAAVVTARRWAGSSQWRPFFAGVLGGVAICVQQQRGAFLAVWLPLGLATLALTARAEGRWRTTVRELCWAATGGLAVVVPVLGLAAWAASPAALVEMLFGFAIDRYAPTQTGRNAWAAVLPLTGPWAEFTSLTLMRVLPFVLVLEALRLLQLRSRIARDVGLRTAFWLLALLMCASIFYLPDFIHVSFILPFLFLPAASLLHDLRRAPVWSRWHPARALGTVAVAAAVVAVAAQAAFNVQRAYARAPVRFATAFGELRGDANVRSLFEAVSRHLVREADGRARIYSYPDDAWLYLALPGDNAMRFSVLVDGFFPDFYVDEVVATVRERRAGTIVLIPPLAPERLRRAVEDGYDAVEDAWAYRIYVRRPPAPDAGTPPPTSRLPAPAARG